MRPCRSLLKAISSTNEGEPPKPGIGYYSLQQVLKSGTGYEKPTPDPELQELIQKFKTSIGLKDLLAKKAKIKYDPATIPPKPTGCKQAIAKWIKKYGKYVTDPISELKKPEE